MNTLRAGDSSPDVTTLQTKLNEHGFRPGLIDGDFGPGTEAAVLAFQKSESLLADGVVGPRTAAALGFDPGSLPPAQCMPHVTVAMVSKMFPATPLDHITANLPPILEALRLSDLTSASIVMVALATIRAETEGFVPISEGISRYNTSPGGKPFDLYDNRQNLGNRGPDDGSTFRGRGYIQLTGRANYAKFESRVGTDLVRNPEQANSPEIAARILAAFIASQEVAIKTAAQENDLGRARQLVNGGSNGLDRFTNAYKIGLSLLT